MRDEALRQSPCTYDAYTQVLYYVGTTLAAYVFFYNRCVRLFRSLSEVKILRVRRERKKEREREDSVRLCRRIRDLVTPRVHDNEKKKKQNRMSFRTNGKTGLTRRTHDDDDDDTW